MRKISYLGLLFLLVFSCASDKSIVIVSSNIGNNSTIKQGEEIFLKFDTDVWDINSTENILKTKFLTFNPPVEGTFRWESPSELRFTPNYNALKEGNEYIVTLNQEILKTKPQLKLPSERVLTFNTGFIEFEKTDYYWDKDKSSGSMLLNFNMRLSMPFVYEENSNMIEFFIDAKKFTPVNFSKINNNEISLSFSFKDMQSTDSRILKIVLKQGLVIGELGDGKNNADKIKEINLSDWNDFLITNSETETNIEKCFITYYFNQVLNTETDYNSIISIEPKVQFTTEITNNKLILNGTFEPGNTYKITIPNTFTSSSGIKLKETSIEYVKLGELEPYLDFVEKNAIYLPSKGSRNVAVQVHSVGNLYLNIFKVYENNILQMFQQGRIYDYYYNSEDEEGYSYEIYNTKRLGELIYHSQVDLANLEKFNNAHLLKIDFQDFLKDKGMYIIRLVDSSNLNLQSDRIVSVSDLGIIAKTNDDDLFVSVNSLSEALPVSGAKITIISENNQLTEEMSSSPDGAAIFRNLNKREHAKIPRLIRVEKGNDINYIYLGDVTAFESSVFDFLGGSEGNGYKAFIYGDRELYRPGDTLNIAGILCDENRKTVAKVPVKVNLVLPNSKTFKEFIAETDDNGGFAISYYIPPNIITGNYKIKAFISGSNQIGESRINIEQFMPERIKVTIKTDKENYKYSENPEITALAENLFGTPAANRNYEGEISYTEKEFLNKDLRDYTFNLSNTNIDSYTQSLNGMTDNKGNIKIEPSENEIKNVGNVFANISLTVFDEGNRPVKSNKRVSIETQPYYIGIGKINRWLNINSVCNIPLVAVKSDGSAAGKVKTQIQIIKKTWNSVLRKSSYSDYFYYENEERSEIVLDKEVTIDGKKGSISFKPQSSGMYEVRAYIPDAESYVSYSLTAYNYGYVSNGAFEVSKEGYIDIVTELEKYNTGDKARLLFKTPFNGRLIVTVERSGILDNYSLTTNSRTAELTLDIKESYVPNIYVSAVLIRPIEDESVPITVAYGYLALKVDKPSTILPVTITANTESRSLTEQTVKIKTIPRQNVNVTVAVVDEGIHQIKRTKTPDPHAYFFEKIALDIKTYDIYKLVFPEMKGSKMSFGGGEGFDISGMSGLLINRLSDERVKPVAFWSGILKTNSAGEAAFKFNVPQFSGTLRISTVAYTDAAFGKSEAKMIVKDPLVLSTSLPRFLTSSDESFALVTISNTTNQKLSLNIRLKSDGPINLTEKSSETVSVGANSEIRLKYPVKAGQREGLAEISVNVSGNGYQQSETVKLPVRFPAGYTKHFESGSLEGNKSALHDFNSKFSAGSSISHVTISKLPVVELFNGLEFLVNYPHGCMEQTISQAFPLLYFPALAKASRINNDKKLEPDARRIVISVIDRTKMLQLPSGGWGMWQSDYTEHWWTSVYAANFLVSAKLAGYDVDEKSLNKALNFIRSKTSDAETIPYISYVSKNEWRQKLYPREVLYGLFVLSLSGRTEYSLLNFYKGRINLLTPDSRVMLACSYKLTGDNNNYRNILESEVLNFPEYNNYPNYSMTSALRDMAISLYCIAVADKNDKRIPSLTKIVSGRMKNNRNLTTQEAAFGFMALGKALETQISNKPSLGFANDGKKEFARLTPEMEFATGNSYTGKADIYSKDEGKVFYFINTVGIPKDGRIENKDSYIKVRRTFFSKTGKEITKPEFKSGEIIVVKISVSGLSGKFQADNMVISDLLPAGFEIENPRLSDLTNYKWIKSQNEPTHFDYRDDRVNIYFDLNEKADFYYTVRAVTPGNYTIGAVSADAMYSGDIYSIYGGGTVKIMGR